MEVRESFTDIYGKTYKHVKQTDIKKEEMMNIGNYITETRHEENMWFTSTDNITTGVYIMQTKFDPTKAYRIYKDWADYGFNGYRDAYVVEELASRQSQINDVDFPTGVLTINNHIIGQEIEYYASSMTLVEYLYKNRNVIPIEYYLEVLRLLKKMYVNGVSYLDIHPKNFIVKPNNEVKVIDFDASFLSFEDKNNFDKKRILENYTNMINHLNEILELKDSKLKQTDEFDSTYNQLNEIKQKLLRK